MSAPLRTSRTRALTGAIALLLGLVVFLFVLPDASARKAQEKKSLANATAMLQTQKEGLQRMKDLDARLRQDRQVLTDLESRLPSGNSGVLQWDLSRRLYATAGSEGVRLQTVKYSPPTKEGGLEAVDVEFTVIGLYTNLKSFMRSIEDSDNHSIEGAGSPFAVRDARLEESPEGVRLTVVLRAFRPRSGKEGEEA